MSVGLPSLSMYWRVACGVRGVWRVACGVWRVACGVWRVACGLWRVQELPERTDSDRSVTVAD